MREYNPLRAPKAAKWLTLDESERVDLVFQFPERKQLVVPNMNAMSYV
jgi:hypothetical protein